MSYVIAGVGVATLGYNIYNSAHKSSKAKKLAKQNKRPVYNPDGSIREVYDLAQSEMSNPQIEDYATQQLNNNASNGIDAILKSGGKADFSTINNSYGTTLQPLLQSIRQDRAAKIASFTNSAYNLAKSRDAAFQYNQDAPFKDKQQEIGQLRLESAQAAQQAANTAISTAANYGIATAKPGSGDISGDGATLKGTTGAMEQPVFGGRNTVDRTGITPRPISAPSQSPDNAPTLIDPGFNNFQYNDGVGIVDSYDIYGMPIYKKP